MPMDDRLRQLLDQISALEEELRRELQRKRAEFLYEIEEKRILFQREAAEHHRRLVKSIPRYLLDANPRHILSAPVIWLCLVPALLLDGAVALFQAVCFPIYGIPKVPRREFVVMDRSYLGYLNPIEKLNCFYCSYFVGLIAWVGEVAARTEQFWCPIKHARRVAVVHSRYGRFFDYGDGENYRREVQRVRRDFADLQQGGEGSGGG